MPGDDDLRGFDHPSLNYKPPKLLRRFRAVMALLLSTLLVVGVWSFAWITVANLAKKQVADWIDAQNETGNNISFLESDLSGYPTRVVLTYKNPEIKIAGTNLIEFNVDEAAINIKPWTPWQGRIDIIGDIGLKISTNNGPINLNGKTERFSLLVNPGRYIPDRIKMDITNLEFVGTAVNNAANSARDNINFSANSINIDASASDDALKVKLRSANMILPWDESAPISNKAEKVEADFKIIKPLLLKENTSITAMLSAWRDNGGKVMVDNMVLHGRPLSVSAGGNIFLDENMQPSGRLSAKITGLLPTINRFRDKGIIRDSDAVLAKMTLAALSQKTSDGRSFLNLSVEAKDSFLYLGPIAISKLPEIKW